MSDCVFRVGQRVRVVREVRDPFGSPLPRGHTARVLELLHGGMVLIRHPDRSLFMVHARDLDLAIPGRKAGRNTKE